MPAQTYAQRKAEVRRQLSKVKAALNLHNGALERTRREAARLLGRKTIITPDDLVKLDQWWNTTVLTSQNVTSALTNLYYVANAGL